MKAFFGVSECGGFKATLELETDAQRIQQIIKSLDYVLDDRFSLICFFKGGLAGKSTNQALTQLINYQHCPKILDCQSDKLTHECQLFQGAVIEFAIASESRLQNSDDSTMKPDRN